jgi:hypothetical protein
VRENRGEGREVLGDKNLDDAVDGQRALHFKYRVESCPDEGPERQTERGSEGEPIKILLKNSACESKITWTPPQTSLTKST